MITFTKEAWEHYLYWQGCEKQIVERINKLIKDILRDADRRIFRVSREQEE